jgi:uncharacterized SAM-binding protein YcdF (DUF218 family)
MVMNKFLAILVSFCAVIAAYIVLVSVYLPVSDPLKKADAIIAVSGGDTQGRTRHAINLYNQGWAPKLIFSGAAADPNSASNAKVMMSMAAARGVPTEDIKLDENSRDTKENAIKTKSIIGDAKTIILVTSDYHQRRVNKEFVKAFGTEINFINSPAKDKNWGRKTWFLTPYGWWISITEPVKLLFSRIDG